MRLRGNKFRAVRTEYRGEIYDSKAEAGHAARLDLLQRAGKIVDWRRGDRVTLIDGPTGLERVTYRPDFYVWISGTWSPDIMSKDAVVEAHDSKGVVTREARIKALLWRQKFPTIPLRFIDRDGNPIELFKRKAKR